MPPSNIISVFLVILSLFAVQVGPASDSSLTQEAEEIAILAQHTVCLRNSIYIQSYQVSSTVLYPGEQCPGCRGECDRSRHCPDSGETAIPQVSHKAAGGDLLTYSCQNLPLFKARQLRPLPDKSPTLPCPSLCRSPQAFKNDPVQLASLRAQAAAVLKTLDDANATKSTLGQVSTGYTHPRATGHPPGYPLNP